MTDLRDKINAMIDREIAVQHEVYKCDLATGDQAYAKRALENIQALDNLRHQRLAEIDKYETITETA